MKKTLLIALLLLNNVYGQTINGIMGIPFGTTKSQIKNEIAAKQPGALIYSEDNKSLIYTNVQFGGREAEVIFFALNDSLKFHTCAVLIKPEFEDDVFNLYDKIVSEINTKYHYRDSQSEKWSYPYDEDDKYKYGITALKMKKLTAQTLWLFPVPNQENNVIEVTITNAPWVKISYQSGSMIKEVVAKNNEKNSSDY